MVNWLIGLFAVSRDWSIDRLIDWRLTNFIVSFQLFILCFPDPAERVEFPRFALPDLVAEGTSWMYTLDRTEVDDELPALILPPTKFQALLRDAPWGGRLNLGPTARQTSPVTLSLPSVTPSRLLAPK